MAKFGPPSKIAKHVNCAEIELALANGVTLKRIAEKYSLSITGLSRYRQAMTPERFALLRYRRGDSPIDLQRLREGESESLLQRIVVMLAELFSAWRIAVDHQDFRAAASLAGQHHKYVELEAKLLGDLIQGDRHIHIEITNSPEYRRLVAIVMAWASDKPDLAAHLAAFLEEQERAAALEAKPTGNGTYEVDQHLIAS